MKSLLILCAAGAAAIAAVAQPTTTSNDEFGTIEGKVLFEGERPAPKPDLVFTEKETVGCHHEDAEMDAKDHSLLISEAGGIANVIFTLEAKGHEVEIPAEPFLLDQHGCRFEPHVVVLPVGATLRFDNSDETNHNVHSFPKKNQAVNKNISGGTNFDQKLEHSEVFEVKCDVHPWMKSYVFVTDDTNWAVSGEDGSFKIEGVPPGTYKLSYWHEELGKGKTTEVTVEAGKTATVEQKIGAKKSGGGGRRRR